MDLGGDVDRGRVHLHHPPSRDKDRQGGHVVQVTVGDEERVVIIGGAQFYEPEDLIGKTVIVVANLEPKKMAGIESDAMLLAADVDDKPFWLTVDEDVPEGTMIK